MQEKQRFSSAFLAFIEAKTDDIGLIKGKKSNRSKHSK